MSLIRPNSLSALTHLLPFLALTLTACSPSNAVPVASVEDKASPVSWIESTSLSSLPFTPLLHAPGHFSLREGSFIDIGVPFAGRITQIHAQLGDSVQEGQPLFTLESVEALQARSEALHTRAVFQAAKLEAQRQRQLMQQKVGLAHEEAAAQAQLSQAKVALERAERTLALLGEGEGGQVLIKAPMAGTILERNVHVGTLVSADSGMLLRLGDPQALWFEAQVFERDLGEIAVGHRVNLRLSDNSTLEGQVIRVSTSIDTDTRRAKVWVQPNSQDFSNVRNGSWAQADIQGRPRQGLVLPSEAVLIKERGQHVVYVAQGEGQHFQVRTIQPGRRWGNQIEILDGLQANERVVTKGALLVDSQASQLL